MISSRSEFLSIRGLRYHLRRWGEPEAPTVFLLHGFLDVSATFQHLVEGLLPRLQVIAPDWRGFGHTQWPQDGYWFPDYVADLDAIVEHYSPRQPLRLVGHSMGAQVASLYAGLRSQRVESLVLLDGLFLPDMPAELAPKRYRKWLDQLRAPRETKVYRSYEELALRVRKYHPRLSEERALFVARCWGQENARGEIRLCADPKHNLSGPGLYRAGESEAVWREISARTLFIDAGKSPFAKTLSADELRRRRECFAGRRETVVAEAGHMLHFDAPTETAKLIADFVCENK